MNANQVFKAGEGAGKSGSFFFFSHDNRFIIKTMSSEEMGWLHEIMPQYVEHFKRNPCSLIAKIFGTFTVQIAGLVPVKVLLMENTLQVQDNLDKLFDLKGSWVARTSHPEEFTLKDNNWRLQS